MSAADAASLSFWEFVAELATWAVILGVAGEGVEIALKFLKLKFDKRRKSDSALEPPKRIEWIERHEIGLEIFGGLFWGLVVIGLVFEWHGSHKAKEITDREARRLTQQLDVTTKDAGEAKERAAKSEENGKQLDLARAKVEMELERVKANATRIDPENQIVASLKADLRMVVRGKMNPSARGPSNLSNAVAMIYLCDDKSPVTMHGSLFNLLLAERFSTNGPNPDAQECLMRFEEWQESALFFSTLAVKQHFVSELRDVPILRIDAWFLPKNAEIVDGVAVLQAGTRRKSFRISNQRDSSAVWPAVGDAFVFFATNANRGKFDGQ